MAIYRCERCNEYIDDDEDSGTEYDNGLICENCFIEILNEVEICFKENNKDLPSSEEEQLKWAEKNL